MELKLFQCKQYHLEMLWGGDTCLSLVVLAPLKNQTYKDTTNQTTHCEQVINHQNWELTNHVVEWSENLPDDCFAMEYDYNTNNERKIYRNTCCTACDIGQWLDINNNKCVDCEAGHQCPSSFDVSLNGPCDPGTYQPEPKQIGCEGSGIYGPYKMVHRRSRI